MCQLKNVICQRSNGCKAKMRGRLARKPCMTGEAELLALADRQVLEWSRPLNERKAELVTDRSWPSPGQAERQLPVGC